MLMYYNKIFKQKIGFEKDSFNKQTKLFCLFYNSNIQYNFGAKNLITGEES